MTNKKEYVSPEVNVILVGEDIMKGSAEEGIELPEVEI